MDNNLGLVLTKRAFLSPQREAYCDDHSGVRLTFSELNARANRLANALLADGLRKGDRVGLLLMNGAEFMEAYFALAKVGAVVVPLNWRLVADELEFILKDSGTSRLIYGDEFVDVVRELHARGEKTDVQHWLQVEGAQPVADFARAYGRFRDTGDAVEPPIGGSADDMLYIMYTSGTTGLPKGVVHTHDTALWALITISVNLDYSEGDRYLAALPMFHVGALTPLAVNTYRGVTSVVMKSFDPQRCWELIDQEKITVGLVVPAMLNFMIQVPDLQRFDFGSLRWMLTGAAPVPPELIRAYADLGVNILQIYGLTESCGPACVMDSDNALRKPESTGRAFFHTSVRIVDDNGNDCAPGEAGEVWIKGAHVMREYWNRPDATRETIVDGWLRTGDVATMDEEGFVAIADRKKDMIISGGENVYPAEVEAAIMSHPGVAEAAVIGQASAKWGESPLAIVVAKDADLTAADVLEHCRSRLAGFKRPKRVEFVDSIPRNPSGKILKRLLREQFDGPAPE